MHANLEPAVSISMAVPSATILTMVLESVKPELDLGIVVTPLNSNCTEALPHKFNILPDWEHIVNGICHSFNVGINNNPSVSHISCKSFLLQPRPILHWLIYQGGAGYKLLIKSLLIRGVQTDHQPILTLTSWPSSKATLTQALHDPRYVLPTHWPHSTLCQCWDQLQSVSNRMGDIWQNCCHFPFLTSKLYSIYIWYLYHLPPNTCPIWPVKHSMHFLERKGLCRSCCCV